MDAATIRLDEIDFQALEKIDQALDSALENEWTVEHFMALHAEAVKASAGLDNALNFLWQVGDRSWTADNHVGGGMQRLPRQVRKLIRFILDGWEPFLALPSGHSLLWNGRELNVHEVEVLLQAEVAIVTAHLSENDELFLDPSRPRGFVRDTLYADLANGWKLESPIAMRSHQSISRLGSERRAVYQFRAHDVRLNRGDKTPSLWIIPLGSEISLPICQNVFEEHLILNKSEGSDSAGWRGIHLRGTFSYTLVKQERSESDSAYFLIVQIPEGNFDGEALDRDLLALQFSLGQHIAPTLAYGIQDANVIAVRHVAQWSTPVKSQVQIVAEHDFQYPWAIDFFEHLSTALRSNFGKVLMAVLRLFVRSGNLLDTSVQAFLSGIALFTYDPNSPLDRTLGERASIQLAAYGIILPAEVWSNIDSLTHKLATQGAFTFGIEESQISNSLKLRDEIRSVLVAMIAARVGYQGPILGDPKIGRSPSWWPRVSSRPLVDDWSASLPPEDATHGVSSDQMLVLVERPEHEAIVRWALGAAGISVERLVVGFAWGRIGLLARTKYAQSLEGRLIVITSSHFSHIPTAIERLRMEFALSSAILICPAIPCVEAWLFADDDIMRIHYSDNVDIQRIIKHLPEELSDAQALAHRVFGPPSLWHTLPLPDVYRAAERSPSLRNFLDSISKNLGIKTNLPAQSVSRAISRNAIAGLIRDLLAEDTIAWRTADNGIFTAEELAREIEQGTEVGRQYTVDLISMMINSLSRKARIKERP